MDVLESPIVADVRRNHGLEHATIHVLTERDPSSRLAGRSINTGFYVYGNVTGEELASATDEALARFNRGERHWAVHPGCGTNYVTMGALAGGMAFVSILLSGRRASWLEKLMSAVMGGFAGVFLGAYAGPWLQANVTTSADMRGARVERVTRSQVGALVTHFVATKFAR